MQMKLKVASALFALLYAGASARAYVYMQVPGTTPEESRK